MSQSRNNESHVFDVGDHALSLWRFSLASPTGLGSQKVIVPIKPLKGLPRRMPLSKSGPRSAHLGVLLFGETTALAKTPPEVANRAVVAAAAAEATH